MKREGSRRWSAAVLALGITAIGCAGQGSSTGQPAPADETRAAGTMTSKDLEGRKVSTVEELLVGKFPGVQVFRTPDGLAVRIRGRTSINADQEPLYVIDGMAVEAGPGGALMGLNPNDIEKIEVLKDVGSTAAYGVRGANGVILITTKRANR